MSQYWESIAAKTNDQYVAEDFESTASRLISEQALYYADRNSRMTYGMVELFEREFKHVLSQVGVGLKVNRQLRYACAIPDNGKAGTATTTQTLLALVLRKIYDEHARTGQLNESGEVVCDLVELEEKYRLSTSGKRESPGRSELESLLKVLKRWGIVRKLDEDEMTDMVGNEDQPYALAIRPAIVELLGETAISRLEQFVEAAQPASEMDEEADSQEVESMEEKA